MHCSVVQASNADYDQELQNIDDMDLKSYEHWMLNILSAWGIQRMRNEVKKIANTAN